MKKLLMMVLIGAMLTGCSDNEKAMEEKKNFVTFEYKITHVQPDGYYGESTDDDTGIFFTVDNLLQGESIDTGDIVEAVFDADDLREGIVYVYEK